MQHTVQAGRQGLIRLAVAAGALALCSAAWAQTTAPQQRDGRGRDPQPPAGVPTPPVNPPGQNAVGGTGTGGLAQAPGALPDIEIQPVYGNGGIEGAPGTGYCAPMGAAGQQRQAAVRVRNKGATASGPFRFDFYFTQLAGTPVQHSFANLAAGDSRVVNVPIPNAAWQAGTAHFSMHADADRKVAESDEYNNDRTGKCVQPSAS